MKKKKGKTNTQNKKDSDYRSNYVLLSVGKRRKRENGGHLVPGKAND